MFKTRRDHYAGAQYLPSGRPILDRFTLRRESELRNSPDFHPLFADLSELPSRLPRHPELHVRFRVTAGTAGYFGKRGIQFPIMMMIPTVNPKNNETGRKTSK
jgi:hypothetical protein